MYQDALILLDEAFDLMSESLADEGQPFVSSEIGVWLEVLLRGSFLRDFEQQLLTRVESLRDLKKLIIGDPFTISNVDLIHRVEHCFQRFEPIFVWWSLIKIVRSSTQDLAPYFFSLKFSAILAFLPQSIELYRKLFENFALESSLGNAAASSSEKSVSRSEPSG